MAENVGEVNVKINVDMTELDMLEQLQESKFTSAFYTSLLWQVCSDYVSQYNGHCIPHLVGRNWYATDARWAIQIDSKLIDGIPVTIELNEELKTADISKLFAGEKWDWLGDPLCKISRTIKFECGDYDGMDEISFHDDIVIGNRVFDRSMLYWVSLIPGVRVLVLDEKLLFKSVGVRGMVMAIRSNLKKWAGFKQ